MHQSRKLAILLPNLRGGGAERVTLTLAGELAGRGHEVTLLLQQGAGELLGSVPTDVAVHDFDVSRIRSLLRPLTGYLWRQRPDALLAVMWPLTVLAVAAARLSRSGTRVVTSDHGTLSMQYGGRGAFHDLFLRRSIGWAYPRAGARVQVSTGAARDLERVGSLAPGSVSVIHNPVPPLQLPQLAGPATSAWGGEGPRLLGVGSLVPVKDHALLLRALALLPRDVGASLLILGEGPLRAALERQAQELGVADRVRMPGYVGDVAPFYGAADLFLLSSRSEALPTVLIEALQAGLPIVSTDCPHGPSEILTDSALGTLVPPGNAEAFARAIHHRLSQSPRPDLAKGRAADFGVQRAGDAYEVLLAGPAPLP